MTKHPYYPVCYDQKSDENKNLGVLSTDRNNRVASFTNYGTGCIDLGAPGQDITSLAYYNSSKSDLNKYVVEGWNGSSFAAGLVSGAAALLKSVDMTLKPSQII